VIGRPENERGEVVVAYAVLRAGARSDAQAVAALRGFVKSEITPYKCPREIIVTDALPRTATGKLQRFRLRDLELGRAAGGPAPVRRDLE